MSLDYEPSAARRTPSLVQCCQRGELAIYFERVYDSTKALATASGVRTRRNLGDDVPVELVKPILQNCSAETLLRLEQASPYLANETSGQSSIHPTIACDKTDPSVELWKALCFRAYPLTAEQHYTDVEPESWRDAYFDLRDWEKQRLEAVGNKLRSQREELEQRRKDSQVKFTDRLPPVKRSRGWGPTQPKTLFQKTRSDAVKMQKGIYGARIPVAPVKTLRTLNTPSAKLPRPKTTAAATSSTGTCVTVTAVPRKPPSSHKPAVKSPSSIAAVPSKPVSPVPMAHGFSGIRQTSVSPSLSRVNQIAPPPPEARPVPLKPPQRPACAPEPDLYAWTLSSSGLSATIHPHSHVSWATLHSLSSALRFDSSFASLFPMTVYTLRTCFVGNCFIVGVMENYYSPCMASGFLPSINPTKLHGTTALKPAASANLQRGLIDKFGLLDASYDPRQRPDPSHAGVGNESHT
ncbi:hypothetical protein NM688_g2868 [Phlebia brevispora]|uniref:Uncharacterized protein n=1 Tax=Phlebia brevispora TaxID=194682 RepID=A0ACC1T743_9APHY|nr:hypothetical protein NM688_g2868 [Phlebia brevispora]